MSNRDNERAKYVANAFDRASTACITIGVLGPTVAYLYDLGGPAMAGKGTYILIGALLWLAAAGVLHWFGHRAIGRIK